MESNYEKLVEALRCKRDDCEGCDLAFLDNDEGWMCQYAAKDDDAAAAIEELQAQLPKRGEWIFDGKFMELHKFRCSNCKRTEFRMSDYCPNCGADMRKMEVQE